MLEGFLKSDKRNSAGGTIRFARRRGSRRQKKEAAGSCLPTALKNPLRGAQKRELAIAATAHEHETERAGTGEGRILRGLGHRSRRGTHGVLLI